MNEYREKYEIEIKDRVKTERNRHKKSRERYKK